MHSIIWLVQAISAFTRMTLRVHRMCPCRYNLLPAVHANIAKLFPIDRSIGFRYYLTRLMLCGII